MIFVKLRFTILRLLERIVQKYREPQGETKVLRHMAKSAERDKDKNETSFVFHESPGVEICEKLLKQMGHTPRRSFDGVFYTVTIENHKEG